MNITPFRAVAALYGPVGGQFAADRRRGVLALNGCGKGAAKDAAESATAAIPVQVEPPSRGEMLSVYAGTAPLQADQEATVVAKVAGEVREILVEEGDAVKAGQVLARLDGDRLRFELQQTEVNLRKLEREYQRTLELFNRKLVASAAVDNARSEMEWLKAARDLAQLNVGYTEIRAPIAGVVSAATSRSATPSTSTIRTFQVTDLDPLIAEVHVPEREFAKLRSEQAVTIVVDASGANVRRPRPAHQPDARCRDRYVQATIEVLDPKRVAEARHVRARRHRARAPQRRAAHPARRDRRSRRRTHRLRRERRQGRTAQHQDRPDERRLIEVVEGLKGDERIVVVGQNGLKSGSTIRLIDESPRAAAAGAQFRGELASMNIVEFAIRRRVTILMLTVALALFGVVSLLRLKVDLLPDLSYPTLTVRTELPGSAPLEVENLITRPVEEAVGIIRNVRQVRSVSRSGQSDVTLEFAWGTDMDSRASTCARSWTCCCCRWKRSVRCCCASIPPASP